MLNTSFGKVDLKSVESALTYRIMHFTEINSKSGTYNLCVDGDDEIFMLLRKQMKGKKFKGEDILVFEVESKNLEECSLIYLGAKATNDDSSINEEIKKNKLVVFSAQKNKKWISAILFKRIENKVVFKVNKTLLDSYNIKISSKVLRLATEVY
ncbi:MAG: hypothetical protein ACJAS4_003600 [Bacteriovoracaceae bacterium]|jgi:hypothetical protein